MEARQGCIINDMVSLEEVYFKVKIGRGRGGLFREGLDNEKKIYVYHHITSIIYLLQKANFTHNIG